MYIPDPVERMEMRIDDMAREFERHQKGVPAGSFRCPCCMEIRNFEPIQSSPHPDSPACCYDCLSPESQAAYDKFFGE